MDWNSDDEEENTSWDTEEEEEEEEERRRVDGPISIGGPSRTVYEAGTSRPGLVCHFLGMGFPEEIVVRAVRKHGEDTDAILDALIKYADNEKSPSEHENSPNRCSLASETESLHENFSDMDDFVYEELTEDVSEKDKIVSTLVDMGFLAEEASSAIDRCGLDASLLELADSIEAAQMAEEFDDHQWYPTPSSVEDEGYAYRSRKEKRRRTSEMERSKKRSRMYNGRRESTRRGTMSIDDDDVPSLSIPNPMVGFGLPFERARVTERKLPDAALGPPYFYYENVALAPKGAWDTISRFLYDIEPEFVDSKFFSAAARKRGYIHNLPIVNRFPLLPIPPKTIQEAFPTTKYYWPKWDARTQLNCLQTCIASAQTTERIRKAVANCGEPPPRQVQEYVLTQCRKWNLIWVGRHKVATLEPDEFETLLGFPKNHTRGGGINRTDRYKSLGNSFQIDTVAYHLSVLKDRYPNGMNVLSLFSGIGGAEVALHRLGIRLNTVVAVEISEVNRNIVRSWWEQTKQTGNLIDFTDIQELSGDQLEHLISTYGRFDLIIGGSPCNNLTGSNRHTRDGLGGKQSSLFYDYFRILDLVKCIMGKDH